MTIIFSMMKEPMALVMPPFKDLPLVDLVYRRVFTALDVPTVVTIVLGFSCLFTTIVIVLRHSHVLFMFSSELLCSLPFSRPFYMHHSFQCCRPF